MILIKRASLAPITEIFVPLLAVAAVFLLIWSYYQCRCSRDVQRLPNHAANNGHADRVGGRSEPQRNSPTRTISASQSRPPRRQNETGQSSESQSTHRYQSRSPNRIQADKSESSQQASHQGGRKGNATIESSTSQAKNEKERKGERPAPQRIPSSRSKQGRDVELPKPVFMVQDSTNSHKRNKSHDSQDTLGGKHSRRSSSQSATGPPQKANTSTRRVNSPNQAKAKNHAKTTNQDKSMKGPKSTKPNKGEIRDISKERDKSKKPERDHSVRFSGDQSPVYPQTPHPSPVSDSSKNSKFWEGATFSPTVSDEPAPPPFWGLAPATVDPDLMMSGAIQEDRPKQSGLSSINVREQPSLIPVKTPAVAPYRQATEPIVQNAAWTAAQYNHVQPTSGYRPMTEASMTQAPVQTGRRHSQRRFSQDISR